MPKKPSEIMELIELHGPNPQLVGIVDGTEDDYGDLLLDVATLLQIDFEDTDRWDHFNEVANEQRQTTMEDWVNAIKERL
jgi:hypothetical protein